MGNGEQKTLGERIVEAARLAVAVHLFESIASSPNFRQQVAIGGAGPKFRGAASARDGEFVTDDEEPARLSPTAAEFSRRPPRGRACRADAPGTPSPSFDRDSVGPDPDGEDCA